MNNDKLSHSAEGDYLIILDLNSKMTPGSLLKQVRYMNKNPHIDVSYGRIRTTQKVNDNADFIEKEIALTNEEIRLEMLFMNKIALSSAIIRS